jgi:hypothetical protein
MTQVFICFIIDRGNTTLGGLICLGSKEGENNSFFNAYPTIDTK